MHECVCMSVLESVCVCVLMGVSECVGVCVRLCESVCVCVCSLSGMCIYIFQCMLYLSRIADILSFSLFVAPSLFFSLSLSMSL